MSTSVAESTTPAEHSPIPRGAAALDARTRRRALWGSAVGGTIEWYDYFLYGTMSGLIFGPLFFPSENAALGNIAVIASDAAFSDDQFQSFGWRIPFLLSAVLLVVGLWIRKKVDETPSFKKVVESGAKARVPLVETFRNHRWTVLMATGAKVVETSTFFIFATFTLSYAVELGFKRSTVLNAI